MKSCDLEDRLIDYAVAMITVCGEVEKTKAGKALAGQLYRSGTSPALNYAEAQSAESKRDFIHKIKIALKELRESHVTLRIILQSAIIQKKALADAIRESNELISIFVKIAKTSDTNLARENAQNRRKTG